MTPQDSIQKWYINRFGRITESEKMLIEKSIQEERQRIKEKVEILKDIDIGCNDKGCLSCHIKRCSYNRVLEILEGEK